MRRDAEGQGRRNGLMPRGASAVLVVGLLAVPVGAAAQDDPPPVNAGGDEDPWLGTDKALQFGAGVVFAGAGYALGRVTLEDRAESALLGFGISLGVTALKEALDHPFPALGEPSWRDFAWGVVGAGIGVLVAWLIDLAMHRDPPNVPSEALDPTDRTNDLVPLLPSP